MKKKTYRNQRCHEAKSERRVKNLKRENKLSGEREKYVLKTNVREIKEGHRRLKNQLTE